MSSIFKDIFFKRRVSDNSNLCTQSLIIFLRKLWSSQPLSSTWGPVQKKYRCMQYISHTYYYILSVYLPSWHRPCTALWQYAVEKFLYRYLSSTTYYTVKLGFCENTGTQKRLQVSSADFIFTPSSVHHHLRALEQQVDPNPFLYCMLQSYCFGATHCSVDSP